MFKFQEMVGVRWVEVASARDKFENEVVAFEFDGG